MAEDFELIEAVQAQAARRAGRRAFFRTAVGAAVGAGFIFAQAADAQAVTDTDILNFALNLEYLEANFYYYAVYGTPIPNTAISGVGTAVPADMATNNGGVLLNAGARAVAFADPIIAQIAREIAADEFAHVQFLRAALGGTAVAQPALDVGITPTGSFSSAARAAGLIGPTSANSPTFFDPYANDVNFLYGAFIFEDVGVTAYKGASPLISSKVYLDAAAGILATEAYHAATVRTSLDQMAAGQLAVTGTTSIRTATEAISNARDAVDGSTDDDQGIAQITAANGLQSNIAPTDSNALAFSRTTGQVLNVVYLNKAAVTAGGFFPAGVNGNIRTSTAQA